MILNSNWVYRLIDTGNAGSHVKHSVRRSSFID